MVNVKGSAGVSRWIIKEDMMNLTYAHRLSGKHHKEQMIRCHESLSERIIK